MATAADRDVPPGIKDPERRIITNKILKDKIEWLTYGYETDGKYAAAMLWCKPGGGPPLHYHNSYEEKFTAVEGDLTIYLDNDKQVLKPGESATVPVHHQHRFTNDGSEEIKFKVEFKPPHGIEKSLYVLYGLANDGLCNAEGLPNNLVQRALALELGDMSLPGVAGSIANGVVKALAAYGRWSGEEERLLKKYWC